jgi:hypothetical protein
MKTCPFPRIIVIIIILLIPGINSFVLHAQEPATCAEKLQTAQTLFEKGQVHQVPSLISGCLESGFTREESMEAFKLIIQSYLFEENLGKADSAMLAFLKKYPEYKLSPTDHSSFVGLFNNYISKIVIQVSVHLGTNMPFVMVTVPRTHLSGAKKEYSSGALNLFGALEAKYKLNDRIELTGELGYSQISFTSTETTDFAVSTFAEKYTRLEIPLGASYEIAKWGPFTPYARLAVVPALNLKSTATGTWEPTDKNNPYDRSGKDLDLAPNRIFMDVFAQAGGGIKFKIPKGYFFAEVRANFGTRNQTVFKGYNSDDAESDWYYMHADDDFRINALNFNLGYTYIFYKPVRREE